MSTTGALTRWFRDTLGGSEVAAEAAGGPNAYAALADIAAAVPQGPRDSSACPTSRASAPPSTTPTLEVCMRD
jgi:hypothetical protein